MAIHLWRENRKLALIGLAATGGIVFASGSSGPVMTTLSVLFALALWRIRGHLRVVRWFVVIFLIILNFIMNDPVYFLMARIDITGGSTGYFRAQLIRSAIEHLNEWWLAGTDYTRHWMVTGVAASADHTDITNHYLAMGVVGGLPLILNICWRFNHCLCRDWQSPATIQGGARRGAVHDLDAGFYFIRPCNDVYVGFLF